MVGQREYLAVAERGFERRVTSAPRGGFKAFATVAVHVDTNSAQRHSQFGAHDFAVRGPGICVGVQPVVHVQCAQAALVRCRQLDECPQQHARIQSAAERDRQRTFAGLAKIRFRH